MGVEAWWIEIMIIIIRAMAMTKPLKVSLYSSDELIFILYTQRKNWAGCQTL
jgi:hypothetical protein